MLSFLYDKLFPLHLIRAKKSEPSPCCTGLSVSRPKLLSLPIESRENIFCYVTPPTVHNMDRNPCTVPVPTSRTVLWYFFLQSHSNTPPGAASGMWDSKTWY